MRRRHAVVIAACAMLAWAGCYRPGFEDCTVTCADGFCPAGLTCGDNGFCHAGAVEPRCAPDAEVPDADLRDGDDGGVPATSYLTVAAGALHTCAITSLGALRCWGANTRRELGVADTSPLTRRTGTPVDVAGTGWTAVDGGGGHGCGLRDGGLYCWGHNDAGQAGQSSGETIEEPEPIGVDTTWFAVATGRRHSCAIAGNASAGGRLYCWGSDEDGQIGDGTPGTSDDELHEVGATDGVDRFTDWVEVSAGDTHTCARRVGGLAYCWGDGEYGQLGHGVAGTRNLPTPVAGALPFTHLSAGNLFTCGLSDGALYCWGLDIDGQLGGGGDEISQPAPFRVGTLSDWTALAVGLSGGCAVRGGEVWCWGNGISGEIGNGTYTSEPQPVVVAGLTGVTALAAGNGHRCARTDAGEVWCWGDNSHGQIGRGAVASKWEPTPVGNFGDWRQVVTAAFHTCAIRDAEPGPPESGELYCWGWNRYLALGMAGLDEAATPRQVTASDRWATVALGASHGCATRGEPGAEELWCWGYDGNGQVGNGASTGSAPARIAPSQAGWTQLVAGYASNCATHAGTRYCWGESAEGQLGDGQQIDVSVPTAADAIAWTSHSLGGHFGCGTTAGELRCWGTDHLEQQGRGAGNDASLSPLLTASGAWTQVVNAWAGAHSCGLDGGVLKCWGNNQFSQLGTGAPTLSVDTATPVVGTITGWDQVAAAEGHTCAIADGDLYCWGDNRDGQLGNEDLGVQATSPAPIDPGHTWQQVSAAATHTCAITAGVAGGGQLYCWGSNLHGQLGDGTSGAGAPVRTVR